MKRHGSLRVPALREEGRFWLSRFSPSADAAWKMDFHTHTSWTDGKDGVQAMHAQAVKNGLAAILFSEHARASSGSWFAEFADEVLALPSDQCKALVGVETRIVDDAGNLDLAPEVARRCHLVVASAHRFPGQEGFDPEALSGAEALEVELRLGLAAMSNENTDILGHPFGMSISRYRATPTDEMFRELARGAARCDCAVELNSKYHSRFFATWRAIAMEEGARISLGSDAHSVDDLRSLRDALEERQ